LLQEEDQVVQQQEPTLVVQLVEVDLEKDLQLQLLLTQLRL
jgi:hypothetical protein